MDDQKAHKLNNNIPKFYSNKCMWYHLFMFTKFASYKVPPVMVSTHGSVVPLAMFLNLSYLFGHLCFLLRSISSSVLILVSRTACGITSLYIAETTSHRSNQLFKS